MAGQEFRINAPLGFSVVDGGAGSGPDIRLYGFTPRIFGELLGYRANECADLIGRTLLRLLSSNNQSSHMNSAS